MTNLLIITGALTLSLAFGYALLRYNCWLEGRSW